MPKYRVPTWLTYMVTWRTFISWQKKKMENKNELEIPTQTISMIMIWGLSLMYLAPFDQMCYCLDTNKRVNFINWTENDIQLFIRFIPWWTWNLHMWHSDVDRSTYLRRYLLFILLKLFIIFIITTRRSYDEWLMHYLMSIISDFATIDLIVWTQRQQMASLCRTLCLRRIKKTNKHINLPIHCVWT